MIIDMHVHVFPDALAGRAKAALEQTSGLAACTTLTETDTRQLLRRSGVALGVVMPIATKPSQQRSINDWASAIQADGLLCFGTVHPLAQDAVSELRRLPALGLRGVKLHPDYQGFDAGDRAVYPIYEEAAALGLPIVFHAGFDPVSPRRVHCPPRALARVARDLPELKIVAAHLGGNMMAQEALEHLAGRDVFLDTSAAQLTDQPELAGEIVRRHDSARVLFGSDCPWSHPRREIAWVRALPVPIAEQEDILWRNAARLLELSDAELRDVLQ